MKKNIYIQLLEEGTKVYRPVPAIKLSDKVYKLEGWEIYNPSDEKWEFKPGTYVLVEEKKLDTGFFLVAIQKARYGKKK